MGYCTLYGDMCGGLAVISDVPKMQVFALARHLNADKIRIPINTIEKPPSAELRPDQKTVILYQIMRPLTQFFTLMWRKENQSIRLLMKVSVRKQFVR